VISPAWYVPEKGELTAGSKKQIECRPKNRMILRMEARIGDVESSIGGKGCPPLETWTE